MTAYATALPPAAGYTLTARVLHWLMAVLVLIQIPLGVLIANLEMGDALYSLHKSIGVLILPLVVIRLLWRLTHPAPPLPSDIPPHQRFAAEAMHWVFYALLFVQPIIGWIATSAYPAPVPFFGLFNLPPIWGEDNALAERLYFVHRWLGIGMAFLLCGHIGAALFHHFIRKDDVLTRMLRS